MGLKKKDINRFKKLLEEKRAELLARYSNAKQEGRQAVSEGGEDYVDDAVTSYTREFILSLSDLDRRTLALVEEALQRIRDGEYGICLMSGDDIPIKRLEAVPWARYTARCQEMVEREEMADLPLRDFEKETEAEPDKSDSDQSDSDEDSDDNSPVVSDDDDSGSGFEGDDDEEEEDDEDK